MRVLAGLLRHGGHLTADLIQRRGLLVGASGEVVCRLGDLDGRVRHLVRGDADVPEGVVEDGDRLVEGVLEICKVSLELPVKLVAEVTVRHPLEGLDERGVALDKGVDHAVDAVAQLLVVAREQLAVGPLAELALVGEGHEPVHLGGELLDDAHRGVDVVRHGADVTRVVVHDGAGEVAPPRAMASVASRTGE